ncbi:MAG: hypothetical protein JWP11_2001 [Frankiales bacterium]|jgi:hypothetical protein|nr:hypothetical protein [Frankiales bacterium]
MSLSLLRPTVAVLVCASVAVAGAAGAASKPAPPAPVCNLLTDAAGDGNGIDPGSPVPAQSGGPSNDALDIVSADVASDAKTITGVVRVKKLAATSSSAPSGMTWSVYFTVDTTTFSLSAHSDPTGAITFDAAHSATGVNSLYGPGVTGIFDTAKSEVRISAPRDLFAAESALKPGTKLTALTANAGPEVAIPDKAGAFGGGAILEGALYYADTASGGKDYVAGAPSCVVPGK